MGKRCEDIDCPWFAQDGSCLLNFRLRPVMCPAKETKHHEEKDEWMTRKFK